jgi:hypothetical protein
MLRQLTVLFDEGNKAAAKDTAVKLRVLLHDTSKSTSLLRQLGVKKAFRYLDTAGAADPNNLFPTWGLIKVKLHVGPADDSAEYEASLDNSSKRTGDRYLDFNEWWSRIVIKDIQGNELSRKDLVMLLAHEEGGAHVQPRPGKEYHAISKENTLLGVARFAEDRPPQSVGGRPIEESVRQIAYEVLRTFDEQPGIFANL